MKHRDAEDIVLRLESDFGAVAHDVTLSVDRQANCTVCFFERPKTRVTIATHDQWRTWVRVHHHQILSG